MPKVKAKKAVKNFIAHASELKAVDAAGRSRPYLNCDRITRQVTRVCGLCVQGVRHEYHVYPPAPPAVKAKPVPHGPGSVCPRCTYGYAQLERKPLWKCEECRGDELALWGLKVQEEMGVSLGWKRPEVNKQRELVSPGELPRKHRPKKPGAGD